MDTKRSSDHFGRSSSSHLRSVGKQLQKQAMKQNLFKNWHIKQRLPFVTVKLYHSKLSNNADSDLNENMGGLTDLAKK